MSHVMRWLIVLLLCLAVSITLQPVAADDVAGPQTVYRSEAFGYLFWWDPGAWQVVEQSAAPGVDGISITDGEVVFSVFGLTAPGMTPEACVSDSLAQAASAPGNVRLEAANAPGHPPQITSGADAAGNASASVAYVQTLDTGAAFAFNAHCSRLGKSDTLLWVTGGAAAGGREPAVIYLPPAQTLALPHRMATGPTGPVILVAPFQDTVPVAIRDRNGQDLGILTVMPVKACTPSVAYVVAEGVAADFVIDPNQFVLGNDKPPTRTEWLYPDASPHAAAILRDGDLAVLQLHFAADNEAILRYRDPEGAVYDLGPIVNCGGAGGAMPIRVPLE